MLWRFANRRTMAVVHSGGRMKSTFGMMTVFASALMVIFLFDVSTSTAEECCNIQINNNTSSAVKLLAGGVYKCTAEAKEKHPKNYCTAQIPIGIPVSVTAQSANGKTQTRQTTVQPGKFLTWTISD